MPGTYVGAEMKNFLALICVLFLWSCGHTLADYQKMLNTWVGRSADELVTEWGVPSGTYEKTDGSKVFQYEKKKIYGDSGYATYDGYYRYPSVTYYPGYMKTLECITIFYIDKDGIITNWQSQGNACGMFEQ